jgi:hypothetical protein
LAAIAAGLIELKLKWRERGVDGERRQSLMERYALEEPQAEALDVALGLRGKRILLAESSSLRDAAEELGVATLTYEEVASTVVKDEAVAESPDAPSGNETNDEEV